MTAIFLSYRRTDTSGYAGRVYDRLAKAFGGENVFMDVDHIAPGEDFRKKIREAVSSADVLLAVIGHQWVDAVDEAGRRRLDDPKDFVRIELEAAVEEEKKIIPVLVQGAKMPKPEELPSSLQSLSFIQAMEIDHSRFTSDCERLLATLQDLTAGDQSEIEVESTDGDSSHASEIAPGRSGRGTARRWPWFSTGLLLLIGAVGAWILLNPPEVSGIKLLYPSRGGELYSPNTAFAWSEDPRAQGYEIEIFREGEEEATERFTSGRPYLPLNKDVMDGIKRGRSADGSLSWRVRPVYGEEKIGDWSAPSPFSYFDGSIDRIRRRAVVRVGISKSQADRIFAFQDAGAWTGFDIELVRRIILRLADSLGIELQPEPELVQAPWNCPEQRKEGDVCLELSRFPREKLSDLMLLFELPRENRVDFIISGITATAKRERQYGIVFTRWYYLSRQAFATRLADENLLSIGDLAAAGAKLGAQKRTTNFAVAKLVSPSTLVGFEGDNTLGSMFEALEKGEIDALFADEPYAKYRNRISDHRYRIVTFEPPEEYDGPKVEGYAIATRAQDRDLERELSAILTELETAGVLTSLTEKFIGPN